MKDAIRRFSSIQHKYLIQDGNHRAYLAYSEKRNTIPSVLLSPDEADTMTFQTGYIALKRGIAHVMNMRVLSNKEYGRMLKYEIKDISLPNK